MKRLLAGSLVLAWVVPVQLLRAEDDPAVPVQQADDLKRELERLESALRADPASREKAEAVGRALEDAYRVVRRAMVTASCTQEQVAALAKFERSHPRAVERLLSSDVLAVCQGLRQLKDLADPRAAPFVAYYMRDYGPAGEFALRAALEYDDPLVIAAAIDRLRGPVKIHAPEEESVGIGGIVMTRVIGGMGGGKVNPLFEMLALHEAKDAVPTLLGLLKVHRKSRGFMSPGSNRPGNFPLACQTLSAIGDERAVRAMVEMLLDEEDQDEGGMFGIGRMVVGMPGQDGGKPAPLFQAILELTGQKPRKYGMRSGGGFQLMMGGGGGLGDALVFEDDDAREQALAKFKKWWTGHKNDPAWGGVEAEELPTLPELGPRPPKLPIPKLPGTPSGRGADKPN